MKHYKLVKPLMKYWYQLITYLILTFALARVLVIGSSRIGAITDDMFTGNPVILKDVLLPFILLTLAGTVIAFMMKYVQMSLTLNIQTEVKNTIVRKLVNLEFSYFDKTGTGSIMNKLIGDVFQMEIMFSEVLPQLLMNIVVIVTISFYIFSINPMLMLITLTCYPILLWLANIISKKMGILSGNRRALYDQLENTALDAYNGIIIGRTYNLEKPMTDRINTVVDEILDNEYTRTYVNSFTTVIGNLTRWIPLIICYLYAFHEVLAGRLTLGTLLAFVILLDRIVKPIGELPNLLNGLREQWVSFQRLEDIATLDNEPSGSGTFSIEKDRPIIQLKNMSFNYDDSPLLFEDLDLTINPGHHIALVGGSGSGKSTIFKLLCGFYEVSYGDYLLYNHSIKEWDINTLRQQFALVSQNTYLFPGTIAENVALGKMGSTQEDIEGACKKANIHDFIVTLPSGYNTLVGERGAKLSGGQRQRISIARAFLKEAPILLLDEPTSAVDVETEFLIKEAIDRIAKDRTVITIAHRLSTIENADQIVVFDKGSIVEQGTQESLLSMKGYYYNLYEKEVQAHDQ